ncbi:MAG: TonB-dependent receptor [Prevotella sp.]|nr:TonB-dependent receptor [Prevotella sp.]
MKKKLSVFLMSALVAVPTMVMASDEQHPAIPTSVEVSDTSRVLDLDEVIVISQPKESFRLRQQPLSSTLFSGVDVANLGVRDVRELSDFVPSFTMPGYGSRYTSSMYIRGIGSRVNSPSVGVYLDGIPLATKNQFNFHSYQLDRVDVLRGPQGTLYGMNTEGGLVRLYSRNPFHYQGTDVKLGYGMKNYKTIEASHYNKVGEKFAFSLAGFYEGQDGFFKNVATGDHADQYDEAGGKLRLMYQASPRWLIDYIADYQFVSQNGFPYGVMDSQTGTTLDPNTNRQSNYRRNMFNTGLNLSYSGRNVSFYSTTSYQFLNDHMLMDIDYLPGDFMHMKQHQQQHALTQELTLKGHHSDRWNWTTGAYGSYLWLHTDAPVYFDTEMNQFLSTNIRNYAYYGMLNAMAARYTAQGMSQERALAMAESIIERAGGCSIDMTLETIPGSFFTPQTNLGIYHESNILILPRLTATLGLRYDYSQQSIDYKTNAVMTLKESVMGVNVNARVTSLLQNKHRRDFNQLLPKFGLSYKLGNGGSNIYATVSKGYRAGGFNMQMFSDILQTELQNKAQSARGDMEIVHDNAVYQDIVNTISYDPETSWNYEFGTHLNLLGERLQLDFAGYYMQVKNQQLSVMAGNYGFGRMMTNAGKSSSCGIELSLRGSAFDNHLTWAASYGYTRAVFKEYSDTVSGQFVDYKDKRVPFIPEHTIGGMADYRFDFSGSFIRSFTIGANVSAQGKTYWDEQNTYSQDLYAVLGAHANIDFGVVAVNVWGRNLTDSRFNTFAFDSAATGQKMFFAQMGNPFQMGVDLKFHF